jgi:hypothetical protein
MTNYRYRGLCFTGREHHNQKLFDTLSYFSEREFKIENIIANNVFNWDNYETPLIQTGTIYDHLLDYLDDKTMVHIERNSKLVCETINQKIHCEPNILDYLQEYYFRFSLRDMVEIVELFGNVLDRKKPDVVFLLHEANFWTKPLAYLASRRGIVVITFQEGYTVDLRINKAFSPMPLLSEFSTRVYLWGHRDYMLFKENNARLDNLRIVGAPHFDQYINRTVRQREAIRTALREKHGIKNGQKVVLLALPHSAAVSGDMRELIQTVVDYIRTHPELFLIIRFHPFELHLGQTLLAGLQKDGDVAWDNESDLFNLIELMDLCLLQQSTVGSEILAMGKPIVEINYSDNKNLDTSYYREGVADLIGRPEELARINDILFNGRSVISKDILRKHLEDYFYKLDGKANERIYQDVQVLFLERGEGISHSKSETPI